MAFVNDYLTEEEIEKFRKLNISYGKKICITSNEIVGTEKSIIRGGVICTIDRTDGMYLFYCGDDQAFGREEFWSPEFFVFIQEKPNELIVTRVGLKRSYPKGHSLRCWELYCINSKIYETNCEYDPKRVIVDLKSALDVYGPNGDPRKKEKTNVVFKF